MTLNSKKITRRDFITQSTLATAGLTAMGPMAVSSPKTMKNSRGANDRINIAVAGIRGRGQSLIQNFGEMENVHIKTLCDVDERLFDDRVKMTEEVQGSRPGTEVDIRQVLEDPDIDAVGFATPNHWHALGTIWACQAGKHVYCEKPSSHNIWEGRKMVDAARKYDRIVQIGYQNRSRQNTNAAMKFLHEGGIGDIYMARGLCFKPRGDIGNPPNESVPDGLHYDLWLGPAQERPFNPNYVHYNWHWHWPFGNGDTGNQGPHQFDIARWGLNKEEAPIKITSKGGYYVYDSTQETPNTQLSIFEYADGTILEFETRGLLTNGEFGEPGQTIGDFFYGSEGVMQIDSGGNWKTWMGRDYEPGPSSEETSEEELDSMDLIGSGGGGHFENFIAALRNGSREDLTCDVEVGHRSSILPHLGNIAYRVGHELMFDGLSERFVNDNEANEYLSRNYREPFVVPRRV
ncbi:MAG: Gfo/Idh/MocA family protein [Bacteroidales bacterium]